MHTTWVVGTEHMHLYAGWQPLRLKACCHAFLLAVVSLAASSSSHGCMRVPLRSYLLHSLIDSTLTTPSPMPVLAVSALPTGAGLPCTILL